MTSDDQPIAIFAPALMREMFQHPSNDTLDPRSRLKALKRWEKSLLQMSLYADEIWLPAPEPASRFGAETYQEYNYQSAAMIGNSGAYGLAVHFELIEILKYDFKSVKDVLDRLEALVNASVIRLYDPYELYFQHVAIPLLGRERAFALHEIESAWPETFVNEGLLFAKALGKPYTALSQDEVAVLGRAQQELATLPELDGNIVRGMIKLDLPGFDADPQSLADARKDEEMFEAFRATIRSAFRQIREDPAGPHFDRDLQRLNNEVIAPTLMDLDRQTKKTRSLGDFSRSAAITFSSAVTASLVAGPVAAVTAASISATTEIILKMMFDQEKPSPEAQFFNRIKVAGSPRLLRD